jgi:hypothetical protein
MFGISPNLTLIIATVLISLLIFLILRPSRQSRHNKILIDSIFRCDYDVKGPYGNRLAIDRNTKKIYINGIFVEVGNIITYEYTKMPMPNCTAYYVNLNTRDFENSRLSFCSGFNNKGFIISQNIISKMDALILASK